MVGWLIVVCNWNLCQRLTGTPQEHLISPQDQTAKLCANYHVCFRESVISNLQNFAKHWKTLKNFAKLCRTLKNFAKLRKTTICVLPRGCLKFLPTANYSALHIFHRGYINYLWENSNAKIELTLLSVLGEPKYILGARLFSLNIPPSITIGAATLRVNTEWWVRDSPGRARPFLTAMLAFWGVANIQIIIDIIYHIWHILYVICYMY